MKKEINIFDNKFKLYPLDEKTAHFPYSIKVLLESVIRNMDGKIITNEHVKALSSWSPDRKPEGEIPFIPSRVLLQDFTGVPVVVDLAAMRSAIRRLGGDTSKINPIIHTDLVIDHSIQVDYYGTSYARVYNEKKEFERNKERYALLKWGQKAFDNFRVIPLGRGIVHQVNLEYLASVVHLKKEKDGIFLAYPDTLVGTDSHTTMINALGVLGWGVGGIEAEAVMLGQPYYMPIPEVVGFKLYGKLKEGITATDLVLTITQILRKHGVVGKFVEFYGEGLDNLSLPDRATISNMAPEYGATVGFFPIDGETLKYLLLTGRKKEHVELVKLYAQKQGLFRTSKSQEPVFNETLSLDMNSVKTSLAGPKRPQDKVTLSELTLSFHNKKESKTNHDYIRWLEEGGNCKSYHSFESSLETHKLKTQVINGSIVIAAITSCTNTSNPFVMIGAGLLAKKCVEKGLKVKPYVKTSLAPGSLVVSEYLKASGLMPYLESLGFHIVGYGCTTCIGNSGLLPENVANSIKENNLVVASILSGNRNFEGRINSLVKANYLASPLLVVAYAIAGTVNINLENDPIGFDPNNMPVYLKDIYPTNKEINEIIEKTLNSKMFESQYEKIMIGTEDWETLNISSEKLYEWDNISTYVQEPPFFNELPIKIPKMTDIENARVLVYLGDSITTDHISPAGEIPENSNAGEYLILKGVSFNEFNSYGSRRGNHEVMMRGTFGNIHLKNKLVPQKEGGFTIHFPTQKEMTIYEASKLYKVPLIVIAGKEYGTGSSRDWAAKGTSLLGVKAVIAESFERIHRSNLIGMGVLPLQFKEGENSEKLGIKGDEVFEILGISDIKPKSELIVVAKDEKGNEKKFSVVVRLDSLIEIEYYQNGGILHTFLRNMLKEK